MVKMAKIAKKIAERETPKAPKRRIKKVIIQEEDSDEEDEEEIVYVQKAKAKTPKLLKEKMSLPAPEKTPVPKALPPYTFKFV